MKEERELLYKVAPCRRMTENANNHLATTTVIANVGTDDNGGKNQVGGVLMRNIRITSDYLPDSTKQSLIGKECLRDGET